MEQMMLKAEAEELMHRTLIEEHIFRSCLNCDNWGTANHPNKETDASCALYGVPPPRVIVFGCPKWNPDLPF
jgi:hypothetical protein